MLRQNSPLSSESTDRASQTQESLRVIQIRGRGTDLTVYLRENRSPESVLPSAKVDKQEPGRSQIKTKLRGHRATDIPHRRKGADNQR